MFKLLKTTFSKDPYFAFHRMQHEACKTYDDAIRTQNDYLSTTRVVPIIGVSSNVMFYLSNTLTKLEGVNQVLQYKLTATKGRYSVMTNIKHFDNTTKILQKHLQQWVHDITNTNALTTPQTFPKPTVAFRTQVDNDSESDGTMQSYLLVCSSMFTIKNERYDNPPISTILPTQAWASSTIPTSIIKTATTTLSSITEVELQKKDEIIEKLLDKVNILSEQVTQLLKAQKLSKTIPSLSPLKPTVHHNLYPTENFSIPDHQLVVIINSVVKELQSASTKADVPLDISVGELSTIKDQDMSFSSNLDTKNTTL